MGKAVSRGQALELMGRMAVDTKWEMLSSGQAQILINLPRDELASRFLEWLVTTADHHVSPNALPKLTMWRSFFIGGVAKKVLLQRIKSGSSISSDAENILKNRLFTMIDKEEVIHTIILMPADFGYTRMLPTAELLDPARLLKWSIQNAERLDGHVVELLPAEAGPHIRDQYYGQPNGEILWVAMDRVTNPSGSTSVFSVMRDSNGSKWLDARWEFRDDLWNLSDRLIFRLRKVTQD